MDCNLTTNSQISSHEAPSRKRKRENNQIVQIIPITVAVEDVSMNITQIPIIFQIPDKNSFPSSEVSKN